MRKFDLALEDWNYTHNPPPTHTSKRTETAIALYTYFEPSMTSPQIVYTVEINELPPELLGEIFVLSTHLVPSGKENTPKGYIVDSIAAKCPPFTLVHVCRYWREVALSMQTLWTSFYCHGDVFTPEELQYWLSFARSSPLRLGLSPGSEFDDANDINPMSLKMSKDLLRSFSVYFDRLDSLLFDSEDMEITEAFTDLLYTTVMKVPMPPLRSLEICLRHDDTPVFLIIHLVAAIAFFEESLRHFAWTFNSPQYTHLPRVIPWDVLESVYVESYANVEDFIWCLENCTLAKTVTLLGKQKNDTPKQTSFRDVALSLSDGSDEYCILPQLESLTINEYCDPLRLLESFTFPSLVSLTIRTIHGSPLTLALQNFFVRSQCPLRRFVVEDSLSTMTKNEIMDCLATPYLRNVPEVTVTVWHDREPWLKEALSASQHLLKEMPELTYWSSGCGNSHYHIGWGNVNGQTLTIDC